MIKDSNLIANLITKHLSGSLSPEEAQMLEEWRHANEDNAKIFSRLTDEEFVQQELNEIYSFDEEGAWNKVQSHIDSRQKAKVVPMWIKGAVAAVLMGFIIGAFWWLSSPKEQQVAIEFPAMQITLPNVQEQKYDTDKTTGQTGVILVLDNGKRLLLNDAANGLLTTEAGAQLLKKDDQLIYKKGKEDKATVAYNKIITSKGCQYTLTLSDGTKIWLNSASTIRFPVIFQGDQRKVEITGEAYFEVAHNPAKPFKVSINKMEVEVLGTRFNVNAYADDGHIKTTLLEGKVKLHSAKSEVQLVPGQQANFFPGEEDFKVKSDVDMNKVLAWKEGFFEFDDMELTSIMNQLGRWYNMDIVYEGKPNNEKYGGNISRQVPLPDVLKMLEVHGIQFRIEGKTIYVKP